MLFVMIFLVMVISKKNVMFMKLLHMRSLGFMLEINLVDQRIRKFFLHVSWYSVKLFFKNVIQIYATQ